MRCIQTNGAVMRLLTHWSASVQKNHDIFLMGSLVLLPVSIHLLGLYPSLLLQITWLSLVCGLTLFAKVRIHQTSRVAPTERVWLLAFAGCVASLATSMVRPVMAASVLSVLLPIVFFAVLHDRLSRFRMARQRVSRRREQQSRWRASKRQVLSEWKDRLRWLAGVQHDMRQPLHALGLLVCHPSLKGQDRLEPIIGQISSCQRWLFELAENTMEATRFELGERRNHQIESVSAEALCSGIENWIGFLARSKGLLFETKIHDGAIYTDVRRLKRVLGNLVFNAVEHTYEGSVRLEYSRKGGVHRFVVSDTGPGIDASILDLPRGDGTFGNSDLPKAGIGLYVVKKLCYEMGWNISLENSEVNGTTFVVELADRIASKSESMPATEVKQAV